MTFSDDKGDQVVVTFMIRGEDISTDEISQQLHINPDKLAKKGEFANNNPRSKRYEDNGWFLNSKLIDETGIEKHIDSLANQLLPYAVYIRGLANNNEV